MSSAGFSHACSPARSSAFCGDPAAFLETGTKQCWRAAGSSAAPLQQPLCWDTGAFEMAVILLPELSSSSLNTGLALAEQERFQQSPASAIRTMTWDQLCLGAGCADGLQHGPVSHPSLLREGTEDTSAPAQHHLLCRLSTAPACRTASGLDNICTPRSCPPPR